MEFVFLLCQLRSDFAVTQKAIAKRFLDKAHRCYCRSRLVVQAISNVLHTKVMMFVNHNLKLIPKQKVM
jgi:hypothetical protein